MRRRRVAATTALTAVLLVLAVFHGQGIASAGDEPVGGDPTIDPQDESDSSGADAEDDPVGGVSTIDYGATVTSTATKVETAYADPARDAARPHATLAGVVPGDGDELAASEASASSWPPAAYSEQCAETYAAELDSSGEFTHSAYCLTAWVCGGERIDELVSGVISGSAATGRYGEYLGEMVGYFGAEVAAITDLIDADSINEHILGRGLDGSHADNALPVFYWCGQQSLEADAPPATVDALALAPFAASFGWDTDLDLEYDVPALRQDVLTELMAQIGLYKPELDGAPSPDLGFTWVQWKTWLWLKNPPQDLEAFAENGTGTFRLEARAVVERVDWALDGELLVSCEAGDMVVYNEIIHHPVDDVPPCHYKFTTLRSGDLSATVYFEIQERVRQRYSPQLGPYPEGGWYEHPTDPGVDLTGIAEDYEVHPIYAVNVPLDYETNTTTSNGTLASPSD